MNRIVEEKEEQKVPDKESVKFTERMKKLADFYFSLNRAQLSNINAKRADRNRYAIMNLF
jgi:hypothetical protein